MDLKLTSENEALTLIDIMINNDFGYEIYDNKTDLDSIKREVSFFYTNKKGIIQYNDLYMSIDKERKCFNYFTKEIDLLEVRRNKIDLITVRMKNGKFL